MLLANTAPDRPFGPVPFDTQVRDAARRIRSSVGEALAQAGADATKPTGLARHLGMDKNLAWKVSRIVTDEDLLSIIPRLPGRAGVRILIESLAKAGAAADSVEAVRDAFARFDDMVESQAGDRETLEMMLSSARGGAQGEPDESHRKMAFQGQSAVWGVQARVRLGSHFVLPSATAGKLDLATISGLVDFRRLRADVPWAVAQLRLASDDGVALQGVAPQPIDPAVVGPGAVPVLSQFCSASLPPLRAVPTPSGQHRIEIGEGPVGNAGVATCMVGYVSRGCVEPRRSAQEQFGEHYTALSTPAELAIIDLFVHRGLTFAMRPRFALYSQLPGGPVYPFDGRDKGLLPVSESILDLGQSPPDLTTPEVPRYRQMVEASLTHLGHSLDDFRAFRLKLRYPPVPSLAVVRYDLPEA